VADGVEYSEALIQSLERSLGSAFNQKYLRLTRRPHKPGSGFYISPEDADKAAQSEDGGEQMVTAIIADSGQLTPFYFGFIATFGIFTKNYTLQHASLMVFHDVYSGTLTPLFRAEWDHLAASDATSKHAQPHWHFVQRPRQIEGILRALIGPPRDFTTKEEDTLFASLDDCGRLHFAMTSLLPFKKETFQSDSFQKWFKNLTNYIAEQINYLMLKAPSAAIPAREFTPDSMPSGTE